MNHLAIMRYPWMKYLEDGKKTIESRCSQKKIAPYGKVHVGDWIYFRPVGKFLVYLRAKVKRVSHCAGNPSEIMHLLQEYKKEICISDEYIESKHAYYLTLIWLEPVQKITPFPYAKQDRQAWITDIRIPNLGELK